MNDMQRKIGMRFAIAGVLFSLFAIFTVLVAAVDVRPVGPNNSVVGFAAVNQFVSQLFGVHLLWYDITNLLGIVAILIAGCFAMVGLCQLIGRKSLRKVDGRLYVLGAFYVLIAVCYLFFERVVVNYRPVDLGGGLEASYPSSHTVIVVCIMATAAMEFRALCPGRRMLCRGTDMTTAMIAAVTVAGRLISGVHWFTDIVGGLLLAAALIALYCTVIRSVEERKPER